MIGKLAFGIAKFTAKHVAKHIWENHPVEVIYAGAKVAEVGVKAGAKVAGKGIEVVSDLAKVGMASTHNTFDSLKEMYFNSNKSKNIKKILDEDDDIFIEEATIYWGLLDDINSPDFEYNKQQLL